MSKLVDLHPPRCSNISECNYWNSLPHEVLYTVLSYVPVHALGSFALTSTESHKIVMEYLNSAIARKQFQQDWKILVHCENPCCRLKWRHKRAAEIGKMMNLLTEYYPVKKRLQIIFNLINKLKSVWGTSLSDGDYFLQCFGEFAHAFVSNWSKDEKKIGHSFFSAKSGIEKIINTALYSQPGENVLHEMVLRQYYRMIYINPVQYSTLKRFWLCLVLEKQPYVFQAKLLLIIHGPLTDSVLNWELPLQNETRFPVAQLAGTLRLLHCRYTQDFSDDHILTLIQEITSMPSPWHPMNTARLLVSCGEYIMRDYMGNMLANGRYADLSKFVLQCSTTSHSVVDTSEFIAVEVLVTFLFCIYDPRTNSLQYVPQNEATMCQFLAFFSNFLADVKNDVYDEIELGVSRMSYQRVITRLSTIFDIKYKHFKRRY